MCLRLLQWLAPALAVTLPVWPAAVIPHVDASDFLPPIRSQVEEAEQRAQSHPGDAKFVGAFAMTLHAYRQYAPAARVYSLAHQLEPRNFDWLYLLGTVQMELGEFEAAQASFQAALMVAPDAVPAALRLAQADTALGRTAEAAVRYRQILERRPDSARAWYGLGRAQEMVGDHKAALESYAEACRLFPEYGAAHFALARELQRLRQPVEAQSHLDVYAAHSTTEPPLDDPLIRQVSELNRGAQVHLQRAAELEKAGRIEDAIREQEAALAADPVNVQAHVNLIALYGRMSDSTKAKEHFDAAIRLNPGRSDAWYNYGVLLLRDHSQIDEAANAFRRALEINPDYAEARDNLGAIYETQGRLDEAAREFRLAISSRPDYPLARFHLGRILVNQRKYDEAVQQFLRALEPESDRTPTYLYALGATLARAGRRKEALRYFEQALNAARAHGQPRLVTSIERDIKSIGGKP